MNTLTGAELIVRLLERQGVRTVVGVHRDVPTPLDGALARSPTIRRVLARHERGAAFIALGMARVSGRPAVCIASSVTEANGLRTALAAAARASIPLICITELPCATMRGGIPETANIQGPGTSTGKHRFRARSAEDLLDIIPSALRSAASGRPGPVLIDVPNAVQTDSVTIGTWPELARRSPAPAIAAETLQQAVELIDAAQRPVLLLGDGVLATQASGLAQRLAEKAGLPTAMTLTALGALPSDHPCALGMHGAHHIHMALQEADLLIACGVRTDEPAIGKTLSLAHGARIVHIDIDESGFTPPLTPAVTIRTDAATALSALLFRVKTNSRARWNERVAELRAQSPVRLPGADHPLTPYGLIRAVATHLGPEVTVATDVGPPQMWVAQAYPLAGPRCWLTSTGSDARGFGLPAAIGAALARPEYPVVCFTDAAGLAMSVQELATAAETGLNIKIVLMRDDALGPAHGQAARAYERGRPPSAYEGPVDFGRIASGLGLRSYDLAASEHPRGLLAESLNRPGPCVISATLQSAEQLLPMPSPSAPNHAITGG